VTGGEQAEPQASEADVRPVHEGGGAGATHAATAWVANASQVLFSSFNRFCSAALLGAGASGYRWAAATVGSTSAASLELGSSGTPVMAIGGFSGSDPAPSLATFEKAVSEHEIHYFVSGGGPGGFGGFGRPASAPAPPGGSSAEPAGFAGAGGPGGGSSDASRITACVEAHFKSQTVGGTTVYNLSPRGSRSPAPPLTGAGHGK
jgi:hypothetical protein